MSALAESIVLVEGFDDRDFRKELLMRWAVRRPRRRPRCTASRLRSRISLPRERSSMSCRTRHGRARSRVGQSSRTVAEL